jgi:hypothetical protein
MPRSLITLALTAVALVHISATTRPSDDPAKRIAHELREYLKEARVESVEFRLNDETEPRLRLSKRDEIAGVVKSFVEALSADDLQVGKQRHRPSRNVHIRFVVKDGPDVRLNYVGLDMFWATKSDEEPEWKPKWVNLQTAALTKCFRKQIDEVSPTTRPSRPRK